MHECAEKHIAFTLPISQTIPIHDATPPSTYPPIHGAEGYPASVATGVGGVIAGAALGTAWVASQRFKSSREAIQEETPKPLPPTQGGL